MRNYRDRFLIATVILSLAFIVLGGRLWYLQILEGSKFEEFSRENRFRFYRIPAPRGRILDRMGREIVSNRPSFDAYVIPDDVGNPESLAESVSNALGVDADALVVALRRGLKENRFKQILIAKDISRDQLAFLEARRISFPGLNIEVNHTRKYPYEKLGASFLGYVGKPTEEEIKQTPGIGGDDDIGKSGLEKTLDGYLRGQNGFSAKLTDAFGREVSDELFQYDLKRQPSVQGSDLVLSINLELQQAAEAALGQRAGAVVAVDTRSGEVLAMVSHPTYDPRDFVGKIDSKKWKELTEDKSYPMLNRATQASYAPGSVLKIAVAVAGLKEGVVKPSDSFYCPGAFFLGSKRFGCWKRAGHGSVNFHKGLVQSCDVYFYNLGLRLGVDKLSEGLSSFGFGRLTGIGIREKPGILPSREWKTKALKQPWYPGETVVMSIGQGYLTTTPLQIAMMTAAVANGGSLLQPELVKRVVSHEGKIIAEYEPKETGQVEIPPDALGPVRGALEGVVNEVGGTGRGSRLAEMKVAGKTGTAQVVSLEKQSKRVEHQDHAWFTSYAPAEAPEIAVTVLVENGGKGGAVAAPIAKQVLEAYLKLKKEGNV
ncbi:MAG: penicillin-binding protein 2 [Deltaproteobacteria bacterium]